MKGKNNIWERWWLGLAYLSPALPLYRNYPINLLHISVDWFLYNDNTGLNHKVDLSILFQSQLHRETL